METFLNYLVAFNLLFALYNFWASRRNSRMAHENLENAHANFMMAIQNKRTLEGVLRLHEPEEIRPEIVN